MLIILYLIVDVVVAIEASSIAEQKGASGSKYFIYTILFMPLALLLLIALPDKSNNVTPNHSRDELPEL